VDAGRVAHRTAQVSHWNRVAAHLDRRWRLGRAYHRRLAEVYRFLVPPGQRVLEIGSGGGDLLAALQPSIGVGVDVSDAMIARARVRYPGLTWIQRDVLEADLGSATSWFDIVIFSDVLNDLWDVQAVFERIAPYCRPHTRVIINTYSRLWELPLRLAAALGLANPLRQQNWLQVNDVTNLLYLADFESLRTWREFLFPFRVPLVAPLFNRAAVHMWPFGWFALANFIMARPRPVAGSSPPPLVSVIVPARNEAGNIGAILDRTPELGGGTELVFVEGHSKDGTYEEIERQAALHPHRRVKLLKQTGRGKCDAVRLGFAEASGDVLMILDADITVPPEDLPRFYEALASGRGEFINGARLVYPMEGRAMRFLNLVGNKFFSLAFTWLLGQPVKDTLCGTKALSKQDYALIAANREYFGDFDPFGDYDLLFGAARFNRKIIDLPIRYRERTYGTTQISRWSHGWLLLKMTMFALLRIKFV
jgi:SAM-dependent methyltransferase